MSKTNKIHHKKRHGLHHSRGKHYHDVYFPYLPAILLIVASFVMAGLRPVFSHQGVLAYATEMSISSLLAETNQRRTSNGISTLANNNKLNQAAQAKANDMVQRDYWSHNTPDGQEPWIFIDQTGYQYSKAGENLAYGFATSADTVAGWMNSATHKANMLDSSFTEVGFGFTNGSDFQGSGNETVVVAMYAKPQVAAATSPSQSTSPAPQSSQPVASPNSTKQQVAQQVEPEPEGTKQEQSALTPTEEETDNAPPQAIENNDGKAISRIEALTDGKAPWTPFAAGLMGGAAVAVMLVNHGLRLRRLLRGSRKFILHHPVLDVTMLSIIIFAATLSQTIGFIL
jgi:hypothetical protein